MLGPGMGDCATSQMAGNGFEKGRIPHKSLEFLRQESPHAFTASRDFFNQVSTPIDNGEDIFHVLPVVVLATSLVPCIQFHGQEQRSPDYPNGGAVGQWNRLSGCKGLSVPPVGEADGLRSRGS